MQSRVRATSINRRDLFERAGSHGVPLVERFVVRQQVVAHVAEIEAAFAHHQAGGGLRDVFSRDDREDAGHLQRG